MMRYPFHMIFLATLGISACGQPGPLYLPAETPAAVEAKPATDDLTPIPERDIDEMPPKINNATP